MEQTADENGNSSSETAVLLEQESGQQLQQNTAEDSSEDTNNQSAELAGPLPIIKIDKNRGRVTRFQIDPVPTFADKIDRHGFLLANSATRPPQMHHSDSQLHRLKCDFPPSPVRPASPTLSSSGSSPSRGSQFSIWRDEMTCQLCISNRNAQQQQQEELQLFDEPPAPTKRLPCSCEDRRLHVACLESKFLDQAVYAGCAYGYSNARSGGGGRQLSLRCGACGDAFIVTRRRGRRACDAAARTSFARHLSAVLVLSAILIGFGLWSILHPAGGRINIVNTILLVSGTLLAIAFVLYELWLLHQRYDFVFTRMRSPATVMLRLSWSDRRRRRKRLQSLRRGRKSKLLVRQQTV